MPQPINSPFRWAENRQPSVFAADPAFRPRQVQKQPHGGAYAKAAAPDVKEPK